MKVIRKTPGGETRELLLKEYFLNAYLIAALKTVGDQIRQSRTAEVKLPQPAPVPLDRS
ncbi:hypothetical protein [Haloferula sargassicola]|uniref:Transposase n=1 Tax=Haloferula sargassicola TaxID=490096 RepID=A0ABP9UYH2_9BACT